MEYTIIVTENEVPYVSAAIALSQAVNAAMKQGWVPLGGVAIASSAQGGLSEPRCYQAMTRARTPTPKRIATKETEA